MTRPRLAMSMGDPAGVGPELCCRVAADIQVQQCCDLEIFANRALLQRIADHCQLPLPKVIHHCPVPGEHDLTLIRPGELSAAAGACALASLEAALSACLAGSHQALVTAPINKAAMTMAGFTHAGHTDYLAQRCGVTEATMSLHGPGLTVALLSVHCALKEVPQRLSVDGVCRVAQQLHQALTARLGRSPRLACLGLNPHAGEGGLFGDEEQHILLPALGLLQEQGLQIAGPLPPDTAFTPQQRQLYDGYICCYHDQGLIPFKMLHFADGVNWTLGLPLIRTSPDHGTAFDRAWQGTVDLQSCRAATLLAAELAAAEMPENSS